MIVTGLKPSDDGKAIIVRLLGASDKPTEAKLTWSSPARTRLDERYERKTGQADRRPRAGAGLGRTNRAGGFAVGADRNKLTESFLLALFLCLPFFCPPFFCRRIFLPFEGDEL